MNDRNNTIFGWVLFSGVVALGASIASGIYFDSEEPETPGYFIEGAVEEGGEDALPIAFYLNQGSAEAGEAVFARCQTCHNVASGGPNGIGPNLYGVMGKAKAAVAGFAYSDALSSMGGEWTYENMDAWLESPRAYAPGNKMSFAGLGNPQDRADVMLYMRANGGGPDIPEYVPEEEPAEGEEGAEGTEAGVEEGVTGEAAGTEAEQNAAGDTLDASEIDQ